MFLHLRPMAEATKKKIIDIDEKTEKKLSHMAIDAGLKLKPFIEDILQRIAAGKIKV